MGNKIIVIENGLELETQNVSGLRVEWLGDNGILKIHSPFSFLSSTVQIGSNDMVEIYENSHVKNLFLRCASDDSVVTIGKNFNIESGQMILPRGHAKQSLVIGDNCLFSSNIFIQTSDGHTILDKNGKILNNDGGDVVVGNHVWLGHGVSVLKKAKIADNTIVAASAVVSKSFLREGCILGGVPAKIIKIDVNWNIKAPEIYQKEKIKNG